MQNTRNLVYGALTKVDNGSYSNIVLDSVLDNTELTSNDRRFISALFYGVLEKRLTLDYIIKQYSKIKLEKINPNALNLLRMGVYQLIFMDKIPNSAAVNETVKLAKKHKLFGAVGFINGLLRSMVRNGCKFILPNENDYIEYISVKYSCPESIVKLWFVAYGKDITVCILNALDGRPPLTVRTNCLKCSDEQLMALLAQNGIKSELHHKNCITVENTGDLGKLALLNDGYFHVQDIASQLCCELTQVHEGCTVADVCAAPGGKSFTLAELMNNNGAVYSYDLYESRVNLMCQGRERLGLTCVHPSVRDALSTEDNGVSADYVLCDVPCSGLGVLRRKPEIRYKNDLGTDSLPDLQLKILSNSSKLVKSYGILIYSTCTLNPRENIEVVQKFLENNCDFSPLELELPDYISRSIDEPSNCFTAIPRKNGSDGFFISLFKKQV